MFIIVKEKMMKVYEVCMNGSEVTAISLVEEPAIEEDFIYLSKNKDIRLSIKEERRMVYGAVLRPNFPIHRTDAKTNEEYYLTFPKETISALSQAFMKNGFTSNMTLDHKQNTDGVYVAESWIKESMDNDKSIALGLDADLPIGTWFVGCKVIDDEVWKSIKEGKRKGFSIESLCRLDEIKLTKEQINMTNQQNMEAVEITDGFWDKLRQIISDALGEPQESPKVEETVGKITDEIEVNAEPKDEQIIEQEVTPQTEAEAKDVIENVNEISETEEDKIKNLQGIIDSLQAELDTYKSQVEQMSKENDELKKTNEELSKQPSAEPIKETQKAKDMSFLDFARGIKLQYK